MIIHGVEKSHDSVFAVTQSASSGGNKFGQPVRLRIVQVEPAVFDAGLDGKDLSRTKGVRVLKELDADARNQGLNSNFGKTLAALKADLPTYAAKEDHALLRATVPTVDPAMALPKPSRGRRM